MLAVTVPASDDLGVVLELPCPEVDTALEDLRAHGWLEPSPTGGDMLVETAQAWLSAHARLLSTDQDTVIVSRYLDWHITALITPSREAAADWARDHRGGIITAIGAGSRAGLHREAVNLAMAAWSVAVLVADLSWWHRLDHASGRAATYLDISR